MTSSCIEELFEHIRDVSRRIIVESRNVGEVPHELRIELARAWEEYIRMLPQAQRKSAVAILGYPRAVLLEEIPRVILEDPHFAYLIAKVCAE